MTVDEALNLISRAIETGHVAHGYLICGGLAGNCAALTKALLHRLYPDEPEKIDNRFHPDVIYLEPEGRRRSIQTESMREGLIEPMATTSFSGGWKVGVIVGADRMEPAAANAFLKSLEEPTTKTLYLLLTDQPDAILPTIVSRTQRIDLPMPAGLLEGEAFERVAAVLTAPVGEGVWEKAQAGHRLAEIWAEQKSLSEDEELSLVRKAFYRTILHFVRGWMVNGQLPAHQAYRNVEAVEEAYRQSERSIGDEAVLCFMTDRMVWP